MPNPFFFFKANNLSLGEGELLHVCGPRVLGKPEIRFCAALVPRVPSCRGISWAGCSELPEPWVGGGTGAQFPTFLAGGMSSLTVLQAGECEGAAAMSQPCSRRVHVAACSHCLLFPVAISLVLHCSYIKPNQQFYFHFLPGFLC